MTCQIEIITRWKAYQEGRAKTLLSPSSSNVKAWHDGLYSYGRHFTLAQPIREDGRLLGYLINGDASTQVTSRHQRHVRSVLEGSKVWPSVTIPFSALGSAMVDPATVRIVHSSPPTYVHTRASGTSLPMWLQLHGKRVSGQWPDQPEGSMYERPEFTYDGTTYRWWNSRHLLGESVITGNSPDFYFHGEHHEAGPTVHLLSGWDHQDGTYFLCQLPHPVSTVEEAYASLKPDAVKVAEQEGFDVVRQGDLFFIAAPVTTRELTRMGAVRDRMATIYGSNHEATETATLPNGLTFVRGNAYHRPWGRRPDHLRRHLGRPGWRLAVRNTVPITPAPVERSVSVEEATTWPEVRTVAV